MKSLIKKLLRERLLIESEGESLADFYKRFQTTSSNPDFLENHFKVPNFRLELTHDGNVKQRSVTCAMPNKCETNTYEFIKNMVSNDNHRYYPVSGWVFMESTTYMEHFWVYDSVEDIFLDITPMGSNIPYAYGGVINYDINDEIANSDTYREVSFLLGKAGESLYHKHKENKSEPKLTTQNNKQDIFDLIHSNDKYQELSNYINSDNTIDSVEDLKNKVSGLKSHLETVRSNGEYELIQKIIKQINNINL